MCYSGTCQHENWHTGECQHPGKGCALEQEQMRDWRQEQEEKRRGEGGLAMDYLAFREICGNCGLPFGSHHGGSSPWPCNYCPPGTVFKYTGKFTDDKKEEEEEEEKNDQTT